MASKHPRHLFAMGVFRCDQFVGNCLGMVLLYMEDVYTIENRPFFGYLRGRYSEEELKELDEYASLFDIELVPCIQTLAHMNAPKKWWDLGYMYDLNDILLCDDENTYQWIDDKVKQKR